MYTRDSFNGWCCGQITAHISARLRDEANISLLSVASGRPTLDRHEAACENPRIADGKLNDGRTMFPISALMCYCSPRQHIYNPSDAGGPL